MCVAGCAFELCPFRGERKLDRLLLLQARLFLRRESRLQLAFALRFFLLRLYALGLEASGHQ